MPGDIELWELECVYNVCKKKKIGKAVQGDVRIQHRHTRNT